jgi:hypothetical protein
LASNTLEESATIEEPRYLASNALVEDATIEEHGYWQAMRWQKK